ncbi:MAG: glutathione S-transferase family protein [Pseudomonadales bacterium]|nr:glutathione S-transferase family protein [Pseudomonadales bacterium]
MLVLASTEREYPWGTLRSTNASKVKVILEEKELSYRVDRLKPGHLWKKPPEFLAKHPLGKVPYLETDDDGIIFDSTVINEYLDDRFPHYSLKPDGPGLLARMRIVGDFGDEAFLVGDLPKIWMPMWSNPEDRNEESMEQGRQALRDRAFPYLEKELDGREYLCDEFTLADAPYMAVAMVLEVDGMDLSDFPNIENYLARLRQRESYRSISPKTSLADSQGRD